jgi:hypothetical protein
MYPQEIIIDGKTYQSIDEMPPDLRRKVELAIRLLGDVSEDDGLDVPGVTNVTADHNRNDVPDMLENIIAANALLEGMQIIVDGRELNGITNLSPEARARYDAALRKLDANRNGLPDFVEGMLKPGEQPRDLATAFEAEPPVHAAPLPVPDDNPAITPDTSDGWGLALTTLAALLLCAAGAAGTWYLFFR